MRRRSRRSGRVQTSLQVAQIVFLVGLLVVVLFFRTRVGEMAARMLEALGGPAEDVRVEPLPESNTSGPSGDAGPQTDR